MAKKHVQMVASVDPEATDEAPAPLTTEEIAQQTLVDKDMASALAIEEIMGSPEMQDGTCRITRRGATDTDYVHVERVQVSTIGPDLFDFIAKRYGGGKYSLWFNVASGKYYGSKKLIVDPRIPEGEFFKMQREPTPVASGTSAALDKLVDKLTATGGHDQTLMITFLKMMQDQAAAMMNLQTQSTAQMISAMSNMVAALKGGGGDRPGFDLLQALTVFNQLKGKDNAVDPIKLLELAHTWFKENTGEQEDEPGWIKLVQALGPVLLAKMAPPGMRQIEGNLPGAAVPGQTPPSYEPAPGPIPEPLPNTQPAAPPAAAPETIDEPMNVLFLIKMAKTRLFAQIEAGATPQDAVDLVNNPMVLTDEQFDALSNALKGDDWKKTFFGNDKLTETQTVWLDEFRRLFLEDEKTA